MRILILFYLLAIPAFAQDINWYKDYDTAKAVAEKSAKPMLVVFR